MEIPSGLNHLKMVTSIAEHNQHLSTSKMNAINHDLNILGISLSILYQAATCHRKCFGGSHILESLAGRAYNLACSSYLLICNGFYDEALNLVRSIGEITNLVSLSVVDKSALERWINSDTRTRLRDFSPSKIRTLLEKHDPALLCANRDWYSHFCENYTHVHAGTKPNVHNADNQAYAGGTVQDDGLKLSVAELTNITTQLAMFISKYVEMTDMFSVLCDAINHSTKLNTDQ